MYMLFHVHMYSIWSVLPISNYVNSIWQADPIKMHAKAQETESEAKIQFAFLECQEGYENKYTTFK